MMSTVVKPTETVAGPLRKKMFFVLENLTGPFRFCDYTVCYIAILSEGMRLVRLNDDGAINNYEQAASLRDEWGRLDKRGIAHAIWLLQYRKRFIPYEDLPYNGSYLASLPSRDCKAVQQLIKADAPGTIAELHQAAKACGMC
jgi:hypothetical protein